MKLNKNSKIVLAVFVIAILVIVGIYLNNRRYVAKYSWGKNYVYSNDQPYGTSILYGLLESYTDEQLELIEKENLRKFLSDREEVPVASYFVIGNHCNYGTDDIKALKNFVRKGNTLFLSLEELSTDLLMELNKKCGYEWYDYTHNSHDFINTNFTDSTIKANKPYRYFYEYNGEKESHSWSLFDNEFCSDSINTKVLGTLRPNEYNFISFKVGKGEVILHSIPLFFTNRHLIRPEAAEYTEKVLSYLPEGPVYWDRNSKMWSITSNYENNQEQTPFVYILEQRSFKWAFYLIWILGLLFLIFNLWRKQKAIPVKFPKSNSTLEFIHTIGELYFSQKDNRKLAVQKMDLFVKSIRTKYRISEKEEEKFILLLSKKANIPIQNIKAILINIRT